MRAEEVHHKGAKSIKEDGIHRVLRVFVVSSVSVLLCVLSGLILLTGCGKPKESLPPPLPPVLPAPAPPEPKAEKPPEPALDAAALFFPHAPGSRWQMTATADGQSYRLTLQAGEPRTEGGKTTFSLETARDGQLAQREVYAVDGTGIYRVAAGPAGVDRIEPPMPVLKLPWEIGRAWTWKGVFRDAEGTIPAESTFKLTGPEALKTPYRDFVEVYRVAQKLTLYLPEGKQVVASTLWLAPKVGLVKQETDDGGQKMTAVLTAYQPATEQPGQPGVGLESQPGGPAGPNTDQSSE